MRLWARVKAFLGRAGTMIFAFCLQCVATLAVMYRETNSWRWPVAA